MSTLNNIPKNVNGERESIHDNSVFKNNFHPREIHSTVNGIRKDKKIKMNRKKS